MRLILAWLSKRFPPKLTVTLTDYNQLREEVAEMNRYVQGIIDINIRLTLIERDVKQLNTANGFVATPKGPARLER